MCALSHCNLFVILIDKSTQTVKLHSVFIQKKRKIDFIRSWEWKDCLYTTERLNSKRLLTTATWKLIKTFQLLHWSKSLFSSYNYNNQQFLCIPDVVRKLLVSTWCIYILYEYTNKLQLMCSDLYAIGSTLWLENFVLIVRNSWNIF